MIQFRAFDRAVEVNGRTVLAVIDGVKYSSEKVFDILKKNGIKDPKNTEWYNQQAWLNSFKEIAADMGPHALYNIGVTVFKNAEFPEGLDTIEKAYQSINIAYQMNHRGGKIGFYKYFKEPDDSMHFLCKNPYPCEFDRGIIEGIGQHFINKNQHLVVIHDENSPCREQGDDSCLYHIHLTQKELH